MAQTARGLLQSLIHKVTDPRFEELYKEPIGRSRSSSQRRFVGIKSKEDDSIRRN